MKTIFTILATLLLTSNIFSQSPEKISYQAVIRDASNNQLTNQQIGMQISILQGSIYGAAVYVETQAPTTNANGLVSIEIGTGTVLNGNFSAIDWPNDNYFIKTEIDPNGGTFYSITDISQLLSVPYALHSKTAETVTGEITETDPTFISSEAANITATDIVNLGNLSGVNTGNQQLSLNNDTLFISDVAAVVDLSELTIDKEWIFLTFPNASINTTTTVSIASSTGNLTVSNNTITLHANVCYELDAKLVFNSTAAISYQWYDITNGLYLGNTGLYFGASSQIGNIGTHFIIKPTTDIEVDLRIKSVSASSDLISMYSYGIIKEL